MPPNVCGIGSGKSTIKSVIRPELLGVYVNPDEIEAEIKRNDYEEYCSEYCTEAGHQDMTQIRCDCGHSCCE